MATAAWPGGCSAPAAPDPANTNGGSPGENANENSPAENDGDGAGGAAFAFEDDSDPTLAALGYIDDEIIVATLPGADPIALADLYNRAGAVGVTAIPEIDTAVLTVPPGTLAAAGAVLAADDQIEAVQKNYLFETTALPNDPRVGDQTHLAQIGADAAWDVTFGDPAVVIAVLDTGVAADHPDLRDRLLDGFNAADGSADFSDVAGHGTAVAGTAAATADNGVGVAGVAGGCSILPVRVARSDGRAASSVIASAILEAARRGAAVINVSFGPLDSDKTVLAAAQRAKNNGSLVFISSGNDGKRRGSQSSDAALFIGAVDANDARASFSTYGPFVHFVAPGVRVLSTAADGDYDSSNGTSFSSPIAAGVAALVWSVEPAFRPVTVEEILRDSALDLGAAGRDEQFGFGRLSAAAAVALAGETLVEADAAPPSAAIQSPAANAKVKGRFTVSATSSDRFGVADVVLSLDGEPVATDAVAPYKFVVEAGPLAAGVHTLSIVATDTSGNASAAVTRTVMVSGASTDKAAPELTILTPADGARVLGTVEVRVLATDNVELATLELSVDGAVQRSDRVSGVRAEHSFFWNASRVSAGGHTLTVKATDKAGNSASQSVRVTR